MRVQKSGQERISLTPRAAHALDKRLMLFPVAWGGDAGGSLALQSSTHKVPFFGRRPKIFLFLIDRSHAPLIDRVRRQNAGLSHNILPRLVMHHMRAYIRGRRRVGEKGLQAQA